MWPRDHHHPLRGRCAVTRQIALLQCHHDELGGDVSDLQSETDDVERMRVDLDELKSELDDLRDQVDL